MKSAKVKPSQGETSGISDNGARLGKQNCLVSKFDAGSFAMIRRKRDVVNNQISRQSSPEQSWNVLSLSRVQTQESREFRLAVISRKPLSGSEINFVCDTQNHNIRHNTSTCAVLSLSFLLRPIRMQLPRSTRVRIEEPFPSATPADTMKRCTTCNIVARMPAVSPLARAAASSSNARVTDLQPRSSTMVSV